MFLFFFFLGFLSHFHSTQGARETERDEDEHIAGSRLEAQKSC